MCLAGKEEDLCRGGVGNSGDLNACHMVEESLECQVRGPGNYSKVM